MKGIPEYLTSEVPAFGKLIEAIRELTEAGVIKWRNHVDKDSATLRLNITGQMRSPAFNRGAVAVEVGVTEMPNYSVSLVAGDEAEKLNTLLCTYPVDTDETDAQSMVDRIMADAKNAECEEQQMKSFEVERTTIVTAYSRTTIPAADKYAAQAFARENADTLDWTETSSEEEIDFSAEEQDENGETKYERHAREFHASLAAEKK